MLSATALANFRELQPSKTEEALINMVRNYTCTKYVYTCIRIIMKSGIIMLYRILCNIDCMQVEFKKKRVSYNQVASLHSTGHKLRAPS